MARLPEFDSRAQMTISPSGTMIDVEAAGQGGRDIQKVGAAIGDVAQVWQKAKNFSWKVNKQNELNQGLKDSLTKAYDDQNLDNAEVYHSKFRELYDKSLADAPDNFARQEFSVYANNEVAKAGIQLDSMYRKKLIDRGKAGVIVSGQQNKDNYLVSGDLNLKERQKDVLDDAHKNHFLSDVELVNEYIKVNNWDKERAEYDISVDPLLAKQRLDEGFYVDLKEEQKVALKKAATRGLNDLAVKTRDDLNTRLLNDELTLEEIQAVNRPKEEGGIGGTAAKTLTKALETSYKNKLENIPVDQMSSHDYKLSQDYIGLIDAMVSDQVDNYKAKDILIDALSDSVLSTPEAKKLSAIKANLEAQKFNAKTDLFTNSVKSVKSWFGQNNPSTTELATSFKKLISSVSEGENPEKAADEILRQEHNSLYPEAPLAKDQKVFDPARARDIVFKMAEDFYKFEMLKSAVNVKIASGFGAGVAATVEGTGASLESMGKRGTLKFVSPLMNTEINGKPIIEHIGASISNMGERVRQELTPPNQDFLDQLAAGFGSMSTFFIPGLGIAKGLQMASLAPRVSTWVGISASSFLEASVEGGFSFKRAIEAGVPSKQATDIGSAVFWANVPVLAVTNRVGIFGEAGPMVARALKTGSFEGFQELSQGVFSNLVANDPVLKDGLNSFTIGAIVGGGTSVLSQNAVKELAPLDEAKILMDKLRSEKGEVINPFAEGQPEDVSKLSPLHQEALKYKTPEEFVGKNINPYELTNEEFQKLPIINYMEKALKDKKNPMTVKERDAIAEKLVEQGLMSIDAFNAMTGQHGFGGDVVGVQNLSTGKPIPSKSIEGDTGKLLNYISQWQMFRNVALFSHRELIIKALVEGKRVPKSVIDSYKDYGWIEADGTTASGGIGVTLKEAVESHGVKFNPDLIVEDNRKSQLIEIYNEAHKIGNIISGLDESYRPYNANKPDKGGIFNWTRNDINEIGKVIKNVDGGDYKTSSFAGWAHISINETNTGKIASSDVFELAPDLQGKGVGRVLWGKVEDKARELGAKEFEITHVMSDARGFWKKMGYEPRGGDEASRIWVKSLEKEGEGIKLSDVVTLEETAQVKQIINEAGGEFKVITDLKNSLYEDEPTIYYDTPGGSTQTIRPSQLTVENVRAKISKFIQGSLESKPTLAASEVKSTVRKQTGQFQSQEKTLSERQAFIQSLKDRVKAARESRAVTREEIFDIQRSLVEVVDNSNLEPQDKAKFLKTIKNIQTQAEFEKALPEISDRIVDLEKAESKRALISEIKKTTEKAKASKTIAVDFVEAISDLTDEVDLQNRAPQTIEKLNRSMEYFKSQVAQGKDVEIPKNLMKKLDLLNKTPLESLSTEDLQSLLDDINNLIKQGQTKLQARENILATQKETDLVALKKDSVPISPKDLTKADIGKRLTFLESFKNNIAGGMNFVQAKNLAIEPMDVVFDQLDGSQNYQGANYQIFKAEIDKAWGNYYTKKAKLVDGVIKLANDLKLDESNFERIGVHAAREQEGGLQKLLDTGLTQEQIDAVVLTPEETKLYNAMRQVLDDLRPEVEEVMRVVYNKPLGEVKNYFSFMTDFEAMSDSEVRERFGDNVKEFGQGLRKNVEAGFTKERTLGKQKIKLNAMEIFLRHADNVAYLVEVGPTTKYLGDLAATKEYGEAVGGLGQEIVRDWIDLVARKGKAAGDRIIWLDTLRKNVGLATLGFKLSSALIQPTALFHGATLIGGENVFRGASAIGTSREWRQFILNNFPEIKARVGDDPAFLEFGGDKVIDKVGRASFWALQKLDLLSASSIAAGSYIKNVEAKGQKVDLTKPDQEAIAEAQKMVRRTQSSPLFKDVPSALSQGGLTRNQSIDKTILQFQSFMLNEFSLIQHDLYRVGIKKGNLAHSLNVATWLILAMFAEIGTRRLSKEMIAYMTGEELKDWEDTITKEITSNLINKIPFVSQVASAVNYGSQPVPALEMTNKIFEKFSAASKAKGDEARNRNIIRGLLLSLGVFGGVPGTLQAEQIIKSKLYDDKRKTLGAVSRAAKRKKLGD